MLTSDDQKSVDSQPQRGSIARCFFREFLTKFSSSIYTQIIQKTTKKDKNTDK